MVENNKISKEAKQTLNSALMVLEHAMELALQKEELDAMIAISDRLMMLYQHLSDKGTRKFKTGFSLVDQLSKVNKPEQEEEDDESESD